MELVALSHLLHAYGDSSRPLPETVQLVGQIIKEQTRGLVYAATEVAALRQQVTIGSEEMLFLFRKDKSKMERLLQFLRAKDLKATLSDEVDQESGSSSAAVKLTSKRLKSSEQFLANIDTTGTLCALAHSTTVDRVKRERLLRADCMSKRMDADQYIRFHEARQVNLGKKLKMPKFRQWLLGDSEAGYKMSSAALEIIGYCLQETIAELVDIALLVKQDQRPGLEPLERLLPCTGPAADKLPPTSSDLTNILGSPPPAGDDTKAAVKRKANDRDCITPAEIHEAMRRYSERVTRLHPLHPRSQFRPLLCL